MLKWLKEDAGYPLEDILCPAASEAAAGAGHLEVLKWLKAQGCPMTFYTSEAGAIGGHMDVLKW